MYIAASPLYLVAIISALIHVCAIPRTERQWHDLAHCLAQINFTDRCVRKLQENFACYQDKLADAEVFAALTSILNKAKKFAKPDARVRPAASQCDT